MAADSSPHTAGAEEQRNPAYDICIAMYDGMKKRAEGDMFIGPVTEVWKTLGVSNQYYSRVMQALIETGSVERIQRGHHSQPSIFRLIARPTLVSLENLELLTPRSRRGSVTNASLIKRIEDLERRVQKVDVVAALHNLEQRIVALEKGGK